MGTRTAFYSNNPSHLLLTLLSRRMLQTDSSMNIDCVDPLGRTALLMGIDNENLEMVELLLENKVCSQPAAVMAEIPAFRTVVPLLALKGIQVHVCYFL